VEKQSRPSVSTDAGIITAVREPLKNAFVSIRRIFVSVGNSTVPINAHREKHASDITSIELGSETAWSGVFENTDASMRCNRDSRSMEKIDNDLHAKKQ
jgi:hypothetical protein